jgi:hypothetical protein
MMNTGVILCVPLHVVVAAGGTIRVRVPVVIVYPCMSGDDLVRSIAALFVVVGKGE